MIIITEFENVQEYSHHHVTRYYKRDFMRVPVRGAPPEMIDASVTSEAIVGRRFVRSDGTEITIGMSKAVAEVLGIQLDVWEDMKQQQTDQRDRILDLEREVDRLDLSVTDIARNYCGLSDSHTRLLSAGFWQRLKMVFTGITDSAGGGGNNE